MDDQDLAERYGAPSPTRRRILVGVCVLVAAVFLGWLGWVAWFHGNPDATSELVTYEVVDEHTAKARLDVVLEEGVDATCTVRASAEDHTVVGERTFRPVDGANNVTVRTERRATSVEKVGCTTPDQSRPR